MATVSSAIFNDANLLGQSIALLPGEHDPFDLSILDQDKSTIVKLATETHEVNFGNDKAHLLPINVRARIGNRKTIVKSMKVESGDELARELDASASMSGSYAGFSASASAQYSYSASLTNSKYYAILSVDHTSFVLDLEGHEATYSRINPDFVKAAKSLPQWKQNDEVYNKYIAFFRSWGTHVIKACTFGGRYQLKVENNSHESKSKENFQAAVSAEYSGVASVKGDAELKTTKEYSEYIKTRSFQTKVYGGSSSTNLILGNAPDDPEEYRDAYNNWAKSLDNTVASNLVGVRIDSIGNLLRNSSVKEHQDISNNMVKALDYLSSFRLAEGTLSVSVAPKLEESSVVRAIQLHSLPGLAVSSLSSRCHVHLEAKLLLGNGVLDIHLDIPISFTKKSADHLETNMHYSSVEDLDIDPDLKGLPPYTYCKTATVSVPIRILAPPQPLDVELFISNKERYATTLDLSPRGPRLVTSSAKQNFHVQSLFSPGFSDNSVSIGACQLQE